MKIVDDREPLVVSRLPFGELADWASGQRTEDPHQFSSRIEEKLEQLRRLPGWLTVEQLVSVARPGPEGTYRRVELDEAGCRPIVEQSRAELEGYIREGKRVYGVNTGYGVFRHRRLRPGDENKPSANVLHSHAAGVGRPLPAEVVRAMMLLRMRTFAQGNSAVRWSVLETLRDMLNGGVVPFVPEKGSVGCSGDLSPLAHLFLVMVGAGRAWVLRPGPEAAPCWDDESDRRQSWWRAAEDRMRIWRDDSSVLLSGAEAMELAGVGTLELQSKEGLAVTNGASFSTAVLALGVHDAELLYHSANLSGSLTHQAVSGHTRAFEACVNAVRPHPGQMMTGLELMDLLEGSTLVNRCALIEDSQDDYSIRSMAPVHGAAWDAVRQARRVAEIEANSVTDNPLFFGSFRPRFQFRHDYREGQLPEVTGKTLGTHHCSASNFHGEPIAFSLDFLKIALAELAAIAERRIQLLLDGNHNRGLPANLALGAQGLHSGFMLMQYTAAALVSENKVLCHPSSVDSIPTSSNAEDHVSMAAGAARHLRQVLHNAARVLAVETICGLQALDIRTRLAGELVRQRMRQDAEGGDPANPRDVGWFLHRTCGRHALLVFPEWAEWRLRLRVPEAQDEVVPDTCLSHDQVPDDRDWLDTRTLAASRAARAVRRLLRSAGGGEGGYDVPIVLYDAELGREEERVAVGEGENARSFREEGYGPAALIERVTRALRSGHLWQAARAAITR